MPKSGNKNTEGNVVPTLAEYIAQQIASKRAASLNKSRNRTMPAIPIINGTPNKNSCIYTATDNYGNQYRVPGNWTFYENPGKYGFKPVSLEQAVPGDIIQVFDKGTPYHAMTLDSFDEQGRMKYNYSRGSSGNESDIVKSSINFPNTKKAAYTFVGTQADSTQWTNDYKRLYGNQMKCGGRRKAQLGLDIREGGIAIPIANNMYYMNGRSHDDGGIAIGPNNKNGLEVEGGEVVKVGKNDVKVFSSVPLLRGVSPAQLVMGGANPNKVFKAQEDFKDRNRINDDGTRYEIGGEKNISINNLPSSFRGRKIGNSYYQVGIPPSTNKIKYGVTGFKNYLKGLNDDLDEFGVTFTQVSKKVMPKPLRDTYAKIVNAIYKTNKIDKINTAANQIGTASMATDKKKFGGSMIYEINGNIRNGLMNARPKAKYGKTIKINRDSYETVDEAVERYKQLYRIKYGKEPSESDIDRIAWTKSLENAIDGNPNLITGYGPNVGVRGPNAAKIISGANKGRQIARTQTVVRNKNVKSAVPQRQAINTKVSQAARAERQSQFDAWQKGEAFKASTIPTDAVAVNRPNISTGVRSGRKGRVDDIVAIERSQRSVDPLSSKSEFSVYDKAYAKKVNGKMNQFANALLASGTGGIIAGSMTYDDIVGDTIHNEELPVQNNIVVNNNQTNKSINSNIKTQNKVSNNSSVKGTNNDYVSTTKPNTGESYVINPLTGEWIRNGVTETSEPSVKGTTKASSKSSSTPRGRRTKVSTPKAAPTIQDTVNKITMDAWKASKTPTIDLSKAKMPTYNVSDLGSKETKLAKGKLNTSSTGGGTQSKDGRWVGQYKTTNVGDWIGLGSNLAGTIASYFMTKNAINKMPEPLKPIMTPAVKLKTKYNIQPQLTNISEAEQMNRASVRRNTQSSNASIAREQRLMNEARGARNTLYGQKENIETQLINQDRLNRQSVMRDNVRAYNEYLNKVTATKMAQNEMRVSNINNLISGLTGSVNSILGNIESRRATNNTLRAIAAANPNVDARLIGGFDYYIDPITKKKYNKN